MLRFTDGREFVETGLVPGLEITEYDKDVSAIMATMDAATMIMILVGFTKLNTSHGIIKVGQGSKLDRKPRLCRFP